MHRIAWLLLAFVVTTSPLQAAEETSRIVAVHYPPLMIQDGEMPGWAIEVIREAERRIGRRSSMQFLPFPRAIKTLERVKGTIHPALYRNPSREEKYTWIAKVHVVNNAFLTAAAPVDSLAAARGLGKVGVEDRTAMDDFLTSQGFANLERADRAELNARKLDAGRIDAWFLTDSLALWAWKQSGLSKPLTVGRAISSSDVYIVGDKDFPRELADQLRAAVEEMHADGTIQSLIGKYR